MNCPNPRHKKKYQLKAGNINKYFTCDKCNLIFYISVIEGKPPFAVVTM